VSGRGYGTVLAFSAALAALVLVAIFGLGYLTSSVPPYGFYYDLGVNVFATTNISAWIKSPADLIDSLGWAGWGNRTAFAYAPMTMYLATVPLARMLGGAFEAVKAVQVFEVLLAYLYMLLRGRTPWALVAGALYALLPQQLLMVRGNIEFGMVTVATPLALGVTLALIRRWGAWALPLSAAIASLLSIYFVVEYAFFVAIPVYAMAVAIAYDRKRRGLWLLLAAAGFACLLGTAAYVAFPSVASKALFSPPASADSLLRSGEFAQFGEGIAALASMCINEFIANGRPEFSLGLLQAATIPFGLLIWLLAIGWVAWAASTGAFARGERALWIIGALCAIVSTGSLIPGVSLVWWLVATLPGFNMIRTPDRFLGIAVAVAVVCATSSLERLAASTRWRALGGGLACVLLACGVSLFFLLRSFLGDPDGIDAKEPSLANVNAVALARGERVANVATVQSGSVFDSPLYGAGLPFLEFQGDFLERYEGDGLGGTGMLARGNVATLIAAPGWATDSPLIGPGSLTRSAMLAPLAGDATTVQAYGVEPVRGYVRAAAPACISGGPGLLDHVVALPAFAGIAFADDARDCTRTLYTDSAPAEPLLGGTTVESFPGVSLFPGAGVMIDIDYRIALGRFFISDPWYRNSIDGDSPQIGTAAVSIDPGSTASALFESNAAPYALALHMVCHAKVEGRVEVDASRKVPFACAPRVGFQWVRVPLGRLAAGQHRYVLTIDTAGATVVRGSTWKIGFDGALLMATSAVPNDVYHMAFAFSADRMIDGDGAVPGGSLVPWKLEGFAPGGTGVLLAREPDAVATYRWRGPRGTYRILASAYVDGMVAGSYVAIAGKRGCCEAASSFDPTGAEGGGVSASVTRELHDGDEVSVLVHTAADPSSLIELLGVSAQPDPLPPALREGEYAATFPYFERAMNVDPTLHAGATPKPGRAPVPSYFGVPIGEVPLVANAGPFPANTDGRPTTLQVDVFGGSSVEAQLACGADRATAIVYAPGGSVTLPPSANRNCTATLTSPAFGSYAKSLSISRSAGWLDLGGERWLAAGTYRAYGVLGNGSVGGGEIAVDGRTAGPLAVVARSGMHRLRWSHAPSDASMLALVPQTWVAPPPLRAVRQDASARWSVRVGDTSTLEAAVFPDGYWSLSGGGRSLPGRRCDVENTCFDAVPPGEYELVHHWPRYTILGFLVTIAAWAVAFGALALGSRKRNLQRGPLREQINPVRL
jgi:hypothetical protein